MEGQNGHIDMCAGAETPVAPANSKVNMKLTDACSVHSDKRAYPHAGNSFRPLD